MAHQAGAACHVQAGFAPLEEVDPARRSFAQLPPDQCRSDLIRSVQSLADPLLVDAVRRLTSMETGS